MSLFHRHHKPMEKILEARSKVNSIITEIEAMYHTEEVVMRGKLGSYTVTRPTVESNILERFVESLQTSLNLLDGWTKANTRNGELK